MQDFLEIAYRAAKEAGAFLLENRGRLTDVQINEKARNDLVTTVDHGSEKIIVSRIKEHFPSHHILAEEGGYNSGSDDYTWIIDPLDGTKNYIQNIPVFCISIALRHCEEIIGGLVFDPVRDELFAAEKGSGATLNGEPLRISQRPYSEAIIATGFPFRQKSYLPAYLMTFEEVFLGCSGIRRLGSAALDLSYTAAGRFEGFFELGLKLWDIAAGTLLITEAGGKVTDFWGGASHLQSGFIVAGNPEAHKNLLPVIAHHFQQKNA